MSDQPRRWRTLPTHKIRETFHFTDRSYIIYPDLRLPAVSQPGKISLNYMLAQDLLDHVLAPVLYPPGGGGRAARCSRTSAALSATGLFA